jgi:hypothetical protein
MTVEILWSVLIPFLACSSCGNYADVSKNWGQAKKYIVLSILTLAAFTGHTLSLANQLGLIAQANLYHKSLTEISYTVGPAKICLVVLS